VQVDVLRLDQRRQGDLVERIDQPSNAVSLRQGCHRDEGAFVDLGPRGRRAPPLVRENMLDSVEKSEARRGRTRDRARLALGFGTPGELGQPPPALDSQVGVAAHVCGETAFVERP